MRWGGVPEHGNGLTLHHGAIGAPIRTLAKRSIARGQQGESVIMTETTAGRMRVAQNRMVRVSGSFG